MDKEIRVKFQGGREVVGVLKGYDQLQNLVLDEVREEPTGMFVGDACRQPCLTLVCCASQKDGQVESWVWWY